MKCFRFMALAVLVLFAGSGAFAQQTATQQLTLTVTSTPVTVTTTSLHNGISTTVYAPITLAASGGLGPYTFSVSTGTLPAGLTLSSTGVLSGTPTTPGTSNFTIQAADSQLVPATGTKVFNIVVFAPLVFTTTTIPNATLGLSYSTPINFTGGAAPYTCSISAGSLPTGLSVSTSGNACVINGTPTASGNFTFTIRVTDNTQIALFKTSGVLEAKN